ncbi:MAG: hypothetical protein HYV63_00795 [Candidatus Schekmanbacteria bacterium]|nr:hypothetical protein [Candidatus Schekmanbacteria bacterium]
MTPLHANLIVMATAIVASIVVLLLSRPRADTDTSQAPPELAGRLSGERRRRSRLTALIEALDRDRHELSASRYERERALLSAKLEEATANIAILTGVIGEDELQRDTPRRKWWMEEVGIIAGSLVLLLVIACLPALVGLGSDSLSTQCRPDRAAASTVTCGYRAEPDEHTAQKDIDRSPRSASWR